MFRKIKEERGTAHDAGCSRELGGKRPAQLCAQEGPGRTGSRSPCAGQPGAAMSKSLESGDVTSEIRSRGSLMLAAGSPSPLAGAPGSPPPAPRLDFNPSDTLLSIMP